MARSAWPSRVGLTLLATVSVGALAAPVQAASTGVASVSGTKVQYKAASGKQNKVVVSRSGNTITIDDQVAVRAGKGCKAVKGDKTLVRCTPAKAPTRVLVYTYDRADKIDNGTDVRMTADGGTGGDRILGGARGDRIKGGTGTDRIYGRAGNDYIDAGSGNDYVNSSDGNDTLHGSTGNDMLYAGSGDDVLFGESGNDKLHGESGMDILMGYQGRDHLDGGADADTLHGDESADQISADVLLGGVGVDTVEYSSYLKAVRVDLDGVADDGRPGEKDLVGADVERIEGGSGNDTLTGNGAANYIRGWLGNDTIRGGGGNDELDGHSDRDQVYGEAGDDVLYGFDEPAAADRLDGGANSDTCSRGKGDTAVRCER
ncbi:calcium-binding protein [Actinoplanes aureus]|uniref:Calcium-binding protein n=1 Tax=Actinoplanes aureus TaxID=2792083 RepID=A0A931C4Q8_9ACTN|nr:calcium-binding protein [Actinoplanes aureus]MBG0560423.1 calcium-binding protein [Actinoplanes aureus]